MTVRELTTERVRLTQELMGEDAPADKYERWTLYDLRMGDENNPTILKLAQVDEELSKRVASSP